MSPQPGFRDWAQVIIGTAFVIGGIAIIPTDRNVGISTLALFGAVAAVSINRVIRKLRYSRLNVGEVHVIGGARVRPSRLRIAVTGAGLLALGMVLFIFNDAAPTLVRLCFWLIAVTGGVVLGLVACGILPGEYLAFTPAGLVYGNRRWSALLPWDRIARVDAGETQRNPALFLWLDSPDEFSVTPQSKHANFQQKIRQSREWIGADICIMTTHYPVDLPVLVRAITRYRGDQQARSELAIAQQLHGSV